MAMTGKDMKLTVHLATGPVTVELVAISDDTGTIDSRTAWYAIEPVTIPAGTTFTLESGYEVNTG